MRAVNTEGLPDRQTNKAGLAAFFEVSVPSVDAWLRRGCPCLVRGSRGTQWQFDVLDVAKWRYGGESDSQETEDPETLSPKERLDWYKGNRERDTHAKEQGILIPFDLVEQLIGAAFAETRAGLLSQHNSIAAEFPEIPHDVIRWILNANRDLLTRISETRLPESVTSALDAITGPTDATARPDGEPMG